MNKFFMKLLGITDKGVADFYKSTLTSLFVYLANIIPAIFLMIYMNDKLLGKAQTNLFYILGAIFIVIIMYIINAFDYDATYNATYRESANLRLEIAEVLRKLPFSYFAKHDLSDLSQTIMSDVERIEHAVSHAYSRIAAFCVFFPLICVLVLHSHILLGLAVVIPIAISEFLLFLSKRMQVQSTGRHYHQLRENADAFQEAIELHQEIKSYGLVKSVRDSLYSKVDKSEKIHLSAEISQGIPLLISGWIVQASVGFIILLGTYLYHQGEINILYLLGFILFSMKIKEVVDAVNMNIAEVFYLDARIKRINEMRNTQTQDGANKDFNKYDINLQNVYFSYNNDTEILKGLSLTAKQNQVTALVGSSGCGKTTILRLISRLYDYDKGKIFLDNTDIKSVSTDSLFSNISIVFQDVLLFNNSVMENIRMGRQNASDEEVIEAAKLANCHDFIMGLEKGYQTMLGENGAKLSGGERQRISIARAFIKNAPIILLDEIAASLDVENEYQIQESLNRLIQNKTVLIISHRLKSIRNVDQIIVLHQGRVEAHGSHDELLHSSPTYQKLVQNAKAAETFQY